MKNLILATDSYKQSHFKQYPPEAKRISAYVEARKNDFSDEVLFFGLQAFLKEALSQPIDQKDINNAEEICIAHGVPFNKEGWQIILDEHGGFLPLEIKALKEGVLVPCGVPLVQIENTDERMPWLSTWIETALLRAVWYPSTVATVSYKCKKIIYNGLAKTSDAPEGQLPFKLHDFGARGVSSAQSAELGGMAHLVNFSGTDTMEALTAVMRFYNAKMAGFSIPAAEHSTMTSWGQNREKDAYANMLSQFGGQGCLVAVVSDSYDLDNAVDNIWGNELKSQIISTGGTLVIRPDSGDPVATPIRTIEKLWLHFGGTTNSKGYKVLNNAVRVIQGDGMTIETIQQLVNELIAKGWSLDNIAFGMGGGLLQHINRDTMRFAMKANGMKTSDSEWQDVCKKPVTDPSKASKAGRQAVVLKENKLTARRLEDIKPSEDMLEVVYKDGKLLREQDFEDIRSLVNNTIF